MIGAQLKGKPAAHWHLVLGHLRHADLAKIKACFPEPHTTLFRAIQVSFEALQAADPIAAQRYLALAVMLEGMAVAPAVQRTLWNVDEAEALETADRFVDLSLAQRDASSDGIRLHDLQLDYVRAQYPNPETLNLVRGAVPPKVSIPCSYGAGLLWRNLHARKRSTRSGVPFGSDSFAAPTISRAVGRLT